MYGGKKRQQNVKTFQYISLSKSISHTVACLPARPAQELPHSCAEPCQSQGNSSTETTFQKSFKKLLSENGMCLMTAALTPWLGVGRSDEQQIHRAGAGCAPKVFCITTDVYRCMLAFHFCCEMPGMLNMLQKGPRQGKDGFPSKIHLIFLGGGIMSSAYMNCSTHTDKIVIFPLHLSLCFAYVLLWMLKSHKSWYSREWWNTQCLKAFTNTEMRLGLSTGSSVCCTCDLKQINI